MALLSEMGVNVVESEEWTADNGSIQIGHEKADPDLPGATGAGGPDYGSRER